MTIFSLAETAKDSGLPLERGSGFRDRHLGGMHRGDLIVLLRAVQQLFCFGIDEGGCCPVHDPCSYNVQSLQYLSCTVKERPASKGGQLGAPGQVRVRWTKNVTDSSFAPSPHCACFAQRL